MPIAVEPVESADLDELVAFAKGFERELLHLHPAIPEPAVDAPRTSIQQRLQSGTGIIARQDSEIVGCLTVIGTIADFRPGAVGVHAPLGSCLVQGSDQDRVFTELLTALGNRPELAGVQITAFTCMPHHTRLNETLVQNGFGVCCADAIASLCDLPGESDSFGVDTWSWERRFDMP